MFIARGGGSKAIWTMFKKTALLVFDGFPNDKPGHKNVLIKKWKLKTYRRDYRGEAVCAPPKYDGRGDVKEAEL